MREDLKALLVRVEACSGADRELDADLCEALFGAKVHRVGNPATWGVFGVALFEDPEGGDISAETFDRLLPYTTSLDAALALVERVLPGWGWDVTYRAAWGNCTACVIADDRRALPHTGSGKTPALALLTAALRALISQQQARDGATHDQSGGGDAE